MLQALKRWLADARTSYPRTCVIEVDDAAPLAGALFFKAFRQSIPNFPRHFILVHEPSIGERIVLGYIHQTPFETAHLTGGMVVDAWAFRRLPAAVKRAIHERGGMAEWLLRSSFERVQPTSAIYGYIGDAKALIVDRRVGFLPVEGHPYLHVIPMSLSQAALAQLTERVKALGPF